MFDYLLYSNQPLLYWISDSKMDLYVIFKVLSTLFVVIPTILLIKAIRSDMTSIYFTKGKLRLGLMIGILLFLFFLVTSLWMSKLLYGGKDLTLNKVVSWAPWIFIFVFSNGIKEEVQFRGLFLRKFEVFLGVDQSNLLQAIIFVLAHVSETYSSAMIMFLFLVFLLGLAFGAITQKTNSLIGSIIFHAGTDIPVILGIFSNF
jgi:membrane protease YdiL (CAAX protease family)